METIPPTHYPATRAASLVANYINHQYGGPNRFLHEGHVTAATREDINGADGTKKRKYNLTFPLEDALNKGIVAVCTAEVIYHLNPKAAPEITYTLDKELARGPMEGDVAFYTKMQQRQTLLQEGKIPDDFGNMSPEMEPVQRLARAACGYIVWQNATEETKYNMIQIQSVQQVKREDEFLELNYCVFFHDMVSQEIISWKLKVVWRPGHAAEVKENSKQPRYRECADGTTHQCS